MGVDLAFLKNFIVTFVCLAAVNKSNFFDFFRIFSAGIKKKERRGRQLGWHHNKMAQKLCNRWRFFTLVNIF